MPTISDVPGDKVASLQVLMQRTRESLSKLEQDFSSLHATALEFAGFRKHVDVLDAQVRVLSEELHTTVPSRSDMARLQHRLDGIEARLQAVEASRATPAHAAIAPAAAATPAQPALVAPSASAATAPASARAARGDDLRKIRGIGPGFARALYGMGIEKFAQIAAWTDADIESIATRIGTRPDRIRRDGWVQSARALVGAGGGQPPEPAS